MGDPSDLSARPAAGEAKQLPDTRDRLAPALGEALAAADAAIAADGEQLEMLAPAQVAPSWASEEAAGRIAGEVEAGRRRGGRPPGSANKVGEAFWRYCQALGLASPALEAVRMVTIGPRAMAQAMGIDNDKAAELWVRLNLGLVKHQLPTMASLAVTGEGRGGVSVAFNLGAPAGGWPAGGDGAFSIAGTVGNQGLSEAADFQQAAGELETGAKPLTDQHNGD